MTKLNVSICNHSGMATLVIVDHEDKFKMDLMPDEIQEASAIAEQTPDRLKTFLSGIDPVFAERLKALSPVELRERILHPICDI